MTPRGQEITNAAAAYCFACARGHVRDAERAATTWTQHTTGRKPAEIDSDLAEIGGYRRLLSLMLRASRTGAPRVERGNP